MKTPQEKAQELIEKYGIEVANIVTDEILELYERNWNIKNSYWQSVKEMLK